MLIKNLYANLLDNPLPDVVYLQCHDKKRGRRTGRDVIVWRLKRGGYGDAPVRRLYEKTQTFNF